MELPFHRTSPYFTLQQPYNNRNIVLFQYVTEKMGGAEGTKLDLDFVEMERVSKATVSFDRNTQYATGYPALNEVWLQMLQSIVIRCKGLCFIFVFLMKIFMYQLL